jgi:hypothetical protein
VEITIAFAARFATGLVQAKISGNVPWSVL